MMNKYIKNMSVRLCACCGLAIAATSCTDSFLDKEPDERTNISSLENIVSMLTTCYPAANYGWVCEITSDNIMDQNSVHLPAPLNSKQNPVHFNLSSYGKQDDEMFRFEPVKSSTSEDTPASIWNEFYSSINMVNEALQAINEMGVAEADMSEQLKAARAEALLIRAYDHFILVNIFSQAYKDSLSSKKDVGVPYVTEPVTDFGKVFDRSNVTDTYDKIRADLEQGLQDISDINYTKDKWHFNIQAAHAFAARFYLFMRKYDQVVKHANYVLGTDNEQLLTKMFDFSPLDDCMYMNDFANVWQSPYISSNIMLIDTESIIFRHARSHRYAQGGLVARSIYYHPSPIWRWYANPAAYMMGLFGTGNESWAPGWIGEQFQYSDKVAGIGWAHTIRREFTFAELLLERAEARAMTNRLDSASIDLCTYQKGIMRFSQSNRTTFESNGNSKPLTDDVIQSWFAQEITTGSNPNYNCFNDWDFTKRISSSFVVPANAVPYMNCVNYFRRFETNFTGKRFFDLKRWGIEWTHEYGPQNVKYTMTWDDPRRAIEVPQESIAVGLEPSRPLTKDSISTDQPASFQSIFWDK